ncbi:MAG: GntR family transcriptional regulator [Nitrospinota bacterium]
MTAELAPEVWPRLERESPLPLYFQIYEMLLEKIKGGEFPPGGRLPPEEELARALGVSRMTARQAMGKLVEAGYAFRRPGAGTFVSRTRLPRELSRLTGFFEEMKARGLRPSSRVLSRRVGKATPRLRKLLKLEEGEETLRLERLRLADGEPLALHLLQIPASLCPGLPEEDLSHGSLYAALEGRFGLRLTHAEQRVEAVAAGAREARLLGVHARSPLIFMERITHAEQRSPLCLEETLYRGDRYYFSITLYR